MRHFCTATTITVAECDDEEFSGSQSLVKRFFRSGFFVGSDTVDEHYSRVGRLAVSPNVEINGVGRGATNANMGVVWVGSGEWHSRSRLNLVEQKERETDRDQGQTVKAELKADSENHRKKNCQRRCAMGERPYLRPLVKKFGLFHQNKKKCIDAQEKTCLH